MIDLARLKDELLACSTGDEIWNTVSCDLKDLGAAGMMYGCIPVRAAVEKRQLGFTRATYFKSDYDARLKKAIGKNFLDDDRVTDLLFQGVPFVRWQNKALWYGATERQIKQGKIESEIGLEKGCSILVPRNTAPVAALSVHFEGGISDRELESLMRHGKSDFIAISTMLDEGLRRCDPLYVTKLNPREIELIIFRLKTDMSWQQIAHAFGDSDTAAANVRASIMKKLNTKNWDQVAVQAVKLGLEDF